ncbi:MAG: hypothetical protein A3F31_00595 [Candidatus Levybacteria bacterium RIFCSPHIGHO2_12_FULL_38_12]|nr:MAG: hypothetical protein A2770_02890 [Candidatus Levybacteria bacterium RIFCSPHIGHO2_01_FULL_38_12]OGH22764.1 MAG: hypothetical protein A3F31_00595 [Candidatus Levybacteria bacterium RIFCSPHIGHO2_12_FULL_38_12]OGH45017.1 MAG: hypothetical protein A3J14_04030 [Candidatus Levybacteria bacterium RIFCSPLOWO2_02_FULL_37_18]
MTLIKIGEAAKILGVNKKTLMRWDQSGLFPAKREQVSNIRVYDKAIVEKANKWLDFRKREKEHLDKLAGINKKRDKFIPIIPLGSSSNPQVHSYKEMKKVYGEYDDWKKKYDELQKEDAEFEGFYRRLKK